MLQISYPSIVGEHWELDLLLRWDRVSHCLLEIHTTPPFLQQGLLSPLEPILAVTIPGVAVTFKNIINKLTYGTDFKICKLIWYLKYKSHLWESEHKHRHAGKPMEYPLYSMGYYIIHSKTNKLWPTLTQDIDYWHVWWTSTVRGAKQCGLGNCIEC